MRRPILLAGVAAAALLALPDARAQTPQGGRVAQGAATISATAAETRVRQASERAVIDWRSFDVGRDHRVAFDQPGARSATLNRVQSGRESTIAGQVTAPGTVIIQNSHGVVFAGAARVDVGSLVATSRTVDAGRFAADGRLVIRGGEAAGARVENRGSISVREAGLAALVGGRVANSGTIVAQRGTVALASGETTTIDLAGDGVVRLAVTGDAGRGDAAVENTGLIDAGGGRVVLSAGTAAGLLSTAINTAGVIRAASATGTGGSIELAGRGAGTVRVAGTLDASGARRGGSVTVTGQRVAVEGTAHVAASGREAGGAVRIGGDRQGQGALRRAETATVAAGARIEAAAGAGAGGSVIVWADDATRFEGAISVAGATSGGFAETSALGVLAIGDAASVTTGAGGHWLIDPVNITINAAQAATIVGTLNGGGNVTVTTNQPGGQLGNLTVGSSIVWSGAGSLTLFANNTLNISNAVAVTTSGAGSLAATAGVDTSIAGPVTSSGTGSIRFETGRNMIVNGNVTATGTGTIALAAGTGSITISNAGNDRNIQVGTNSGALTIEATLGSVVIQRIAAASARNVQVFSTSGPVDVTAGTAIQLRGNQGSSWARLGTAGGSSDITLAAPNIQIVGGSGTNAFAEVVTGPGGSITMTATNIQVTGGTGSGSPATVQASGGALTMEAAGAIQVANGTGSPASVQALAGTSLTMRAPDQIWDGVVRSGASGSPTGGTVTVAGIVSAGVAPVFNLAPGSSFTFEPATPGGTPGGYGSNLPLRVDTRGTGTIEIGAPVRAERVVLVSEERVGIGASAQINSLGPGDAIVIAAGRQFRNDAGPAALKLGTNGPAGRWLIFLDRIGTIVGAEPAPRQFDLYGRQFDYADPARSDIAAQVVALDVLPGNRIVYGERPIITVTAETLAKIYGTAAAPGATISAPVLPDPLPTVLIGGTSSTSPGSVANAPVGAYATTPVASLTAQAVVQRYGLVLVPGTLTVNPAPLTVTANDAARTYGAPNPAFTASYSGFVLGQDLSVLGGALGFTTPATPASAVGGYAVTPGGLTSGNYAISFVPGTLTVNPAPLTVTANDAARTYGAPNPAFTATYSGFVLGQDPSVLGGTLGFTTPATPASTVGSYAVTPGGLTSGNYAISFVPGTLTVNPAPLTVTANDTRGYGSPNPAFTATYSGFVLGQDPSVLGGTPVFATPATPSSPVGVYPVTVSGLTSTNYAIVFVPGTLAVLPVPLTVTANDAARPQGQPNPPFSAAFQGFVLGEDGSVLGGALVFFTPAGPASAPGAYVITPSGLTSSNYVIRFVNGTLTVTPAVTPPPGPPGPGAVPPLPEVVDAAREFRRGVQPFTPADAGFRTTVLEAGPAVADPFRLTYSLGDVIQLATGQPSLPGGFVPAGAARPPDAGPGAATPCGGPINLGPPSPQCRELTLLETYWTTIGRAAR